MAGCTGLVLFALERGACYNILGVILSEKRQFDGKR